MNWDLVVIFTFVIVLAAMRQRYRAQNGNSGLSLPDQTVLNHARDVAVRLEQRIETLERVLDEDVPGWRARVRA